MAYPRKLACNFALLGLLLGSTPACTGAQEQLKSRVSELERELTQVQNRSDHLEERLAAVELNQTILAPGGQAAPHAESSSDRPSLSVVRLGPDKPAPQQAAETSPAPAEAEAPPIRITDADLGEAYAEADGNVVSASGGSPAPSADRLPPAIRDYQSALELVRGKSYSAALEAFQGFLAQNPHHPYADNAMYWRGECFYALGDFQQAKREFASVVKSYPDGNKAPDALLKLGMSELKLGETKQARETFARLSQNYPKSEASRKVSDRSGSQ